MAEICGELRTARCFDLESPEGGTCQRCVTDAGEVLYDDCFDAPQDVANLHCEVVLRGDPAEAPTTEVLACSSDTDCGEGAVCILDNQAPEGRCVPLTDGVECEVCTDEAGYTVREVCRPQADSCSDVVEADGRVCTECTLNGELAWRECTRPDVDPRVCEAYGDESARCIDCYGESDELLSHDCSFGNGGQGFCDVVAAPGGLSCRTCYDASGAVLFEECDAGQPPMRCEELAFTDQTCVVCVDEQNAPLFTDCRLNSCSPVGDCPPPPPCEVRFTGDGALCRVCPVEGTNEVEQRCLSGGDLFCFFEDSFSEPPPPSSPDDPNSPPPASPDVCLVCVDAAVGSEVYRSCGGGAGAAEPPVCMPSTDADGVLCETCYDPQTGEALYSSCAEPPPPPDQCVDMPGLEVRGSQGQALYLPSDNVDVATPAIADCVSCAESPDMPAFSQCFLRMSCGATDPSMPEPQPAPCVEVQTWFYEVTQCADPWGQSADVDGIVRMIAYLLEQHGVPAWRVSYSPGLQTPSTCEACGCLTGARLEVDVEPAYEGVLVDLGFHL